MSRRNDGPWAALDPLRDPAIRILERLPGQPFPLSERARERHRTLSDINQLRSFVQQHPGRLAELIRQPFTVAENEGPGATTMQMPPFMRNSNAFPLALSHRQYRLLMRGSKASSAAAPRQSPTPRKRPPIVVGGQRPPASGPRSPGARTPVNTAPPAWHAFRSRVGQHVLVVRGSQILDLPADRGTDTLDAADLAEYLDYGDRVWTSTPIPAVAPQGISLNVTSACNLGCTYCYADRGRFHGASGATMQCGHRARSDRHAAGAPALDPRRRPSASSAANHSCTRHSCTTSSATPARAPRELGQPIGFSVTTNGTRLTTRRSPADPGPPLRRHRQHRRRAGHPRSHAAQPSRRQLLRRHHHRHQHLCSPTPGQATVSARATVVSGRPEPHRTLRRIAVRRVRPDRLLPGATWVRLLHRR